MNNFSFASSFFHSVYGNVSLKTENYKDTTRKVLQKQLFFREGQLQKGQADYDFQRENKIFSFCLKRY